MRILMSTLAVVCVGLLLSSGANFAGDKKEGKDTVLKGRITCAKCDLGASAECATVIVVKGKDKDKDVVYYFDKKSNTKFHDDICTEAKNGTVTGKVTDEGKKKIVTVKKLEYEK